MGLWNSRNFIFSVSIWLGGTTSKPQDRQNNIDEMSESISYRPLNLDSRMSEITACTSKPAAC